MAKIVGNAVHQEFTLDLLLSSAHSGTLGVAALYHEILDNAVEYQPVIEAGADQLAEVLHCYRSLVRIKLELYLLSVFHFDNDHVFSPLYVVISAVYPGYHQGEETEIIAEVYLLACAFAVYPYDRAQDVGVVLHDDAVTSVRKRHHSAHRIRIERPQERRRNVEIKMNAAPAKHVLLGLRNRPRTAVGAVRGQRVEHVRNGQNTRDKRYLLPRKTSRIAAAVEFLLMEQHSESTFAL